MEAKIILSILKDLKVACFKEDVNGDRLGNLVYQNNTFSVKLYRDSVCQYIFLEHSLNGVKNINDSIESINERVFAGRCIVNDTTIVLQTIFPIFEIKFIEQQINNAICVLEKMIHICKH